MVPAILVLFLDIYWGHRYREDILYPSVIIGLLSVCQSVWSYNVSISILFEGSHMKKVLVLLHRYSNLEIGHGPFFEFSVKI